MKAKNISRLDELCNEMFQLYQKGGEEDSLIQGIHIALSMAEIGLKLAKSIKILEKALYNIMYSALSQGIDGDKSTVEDHKQYSLDQASEALHEMEKILNEP